MKRNNLCGYTQYAADKLSSVTNLVLPKSCVNSIDIQQFLFGQSTVADLDASRPTQSSRPTFRSCSRSVRKRHQPTAYQQHTWYARPRDHALSAELVCDMLAFSADFNVAIADGLANFLVDRPRRLPGRQLPRTSQDGRRSCSRGARPPLILCTIVRFGTNMSSMLQAQTLLLQHTATFTKMSPTAFISAMTSSGGIEADCRTFATGTIKDIKQTVTESQALLDVVDTGSGCAAMGQDAVTTATAVVTAAKAELATAKSEATTKQSAEETACSATFEVAPLSLTGFKSGATQIRCVDHSKEASYIAVDRCGMYFRHRCFSSSRPSCCRCQYQGH